MSILKKIIISVSFISLGVVVINYFIGDKNKSVKENVQDNLHLANQYADQGKKKIEKLLKNEEDIFLIDNSVFPFVFYFIFFIILLVLAYILRPGSSCKEFFCTRYTGSMINDVWGIAKRNLLNQTFLFLKLFFWRVGWTWLIEEGIITSVIYSIVCLIKKKPLKYAFNRRFYFRSWLNFFIFAFYYIIIFFIFDIFLCDYMSYIFNNSCICIVKKNKN